MKKLITSLALVLSALSSYAITPLWMRDARISPDGSEIVFCYKGDIYKVPAQEEQLFNSPHKPLMKPIRFGRPMASKLRLPVTGMEILTYSLCLLTEVPPGG